MPLVLLLTQNYLLSSCLVTVPLLINLGKLSVLSRFCSSWAVLMAMDCLVLLNSLVSHLCIDQQHLFSVEMTEVKVMAYLALFLVLSDTPSL